MNEAKKVLVVAGPTASGKTALGISLALALGGEIVSADSMQVYRGMDIGTAKATPSERAAVPHHMLDVADPAEDYSVSRMLRRPLSVVMIFSPAARSRSLSAVPAFISIPFYPAAASARVPKIPLSALP